MGWTDKFLKMVGYGSKLSPIPQHFSDKIDDFEPVKGEDGASFVKVQNFPSQQDVKIAGTEVPIETKATPLASILTGAITVTSTATELKVGTTALDNRKQIILYPPDSGTIYYGNSTVTTSTGLPMSAGQDELYFDVDESSPKLYAVSDGTDRTVRVGEVS